MTFDMPKKATEAEGNEMLQSPLRARKSMLQKTFKAISKVKPQFKKNRNPGMELMSSIASFEFEVSQNSDPSYSEDHDENGNARYKLEVKDMQQKEVPMSGHDSNERKAEREKRSKRRGDNRTQKLMEQEGRGGIPATTVSTSSGSTSSLGIALRNEPKLEIHKPKSTIDQVSWKKQEKGSREMKEESPRSSHPSATRQSKRHAPTSPPATTSSDSGDCSTDIIAPESGMSGRVLPGEEADHCTTGALAKCSHTFASDSIVGDSVTKAQELSQKNTFTSPQKPQSYHAPSSKKRSARFKPRSDLNLGRSTSDQERSRRTASSKMIEKSNEGKKKPSAPKPKMFTSSRGSEVDSADKTTQLLLALNEFISVGPVQSKVAGNPTNPRAGQQDRSFTLDEDEESTSLEFPDIDSAKKTTTLRDIRQMMEKEGDDTLPKSRRSIAKKSALSVPEAGHCKPSPDCRDVEGGESSCKAWNISGGCVARKDPPGGHISAHVGNRIEQYNESILTNEKIRSVPGSESPVASSPRAVTSAHDLDESILVSPKPNSGTDRKIRSRKGEGNVRNHSRSSKKPPNNPIEKQEMRAVLQRRRKNMGGIIVSESVDAMPPNDCKKALHVDPQTSQHNSQGKIVISKPPRPTAEVKKNPALARSLEQGSLARLLLSNDGQVSIATDDGSAIFVRGKPVYSKIRSNASIGAPQLDFESYTAEKVQLGVKNI